MNNKHLPARDDHEDGTESKESETKTFNNQPGKSSRNNQTPKQLHSPTFTHSPNAQKSAISRIDSTLKKSKVRDFLVKKSQQRDDDDDDLIFYDDSGNNPLKHSLPKPLIVEVPINRYGEVFYPNDSEAPASPIDDASTQSRCSSQNSAELAFGSFDHHRLSHDVLDVFLNNSLRDDSTVTSDSSRGLRGISSSILFVSSNLSFPHLPYANLALDNQSCASRQNSRFETTKSVLAVSSNCFFNESSGSDDMTMTTRESMDTGTQNWHK